LFDKNLSGIRSGDERALCRVIDLYSAYVCTVIRNTVRDSLSHEDIEEIASDVFFSLWENASHIKKDSLKSYLGAVAHNHAVNRLRKLSESLPLDDNVVSLETAIEEQIVSYEEREAVKSAVLGMNSPDREIFLRYYYNAEPIAEVAVCTGLSEAAVKHRLARGREKLRSCIIKEGFVNAKQ
jgi:RNA polymerase sigma-70 factor (ECF subfamily)